MPCRTGAFLSQIILISGLRPSHHQHGSRRVSSPVSRRNVAICLPVCTRHQWTLGISSINVITSGHRISNVRNVRKYRSSVFLVSLILLLTHAAARSLTHSVAGARGTYLRPTVVLPRNIRASSSVHPPASQSSTPLISKQLRMHASPRSLSKRRRPSWRISRLVHFSPPLPST